MGLVSPKTGRSQNTLWLGSKAVSCKHVYSVYLDPLVEQSLHRGNVLIGVSLFVINGDRSKAQPASPAHPGFNRPKRRSGCHAIYLTYE